MVQGGIQGLSRSLYASMIPAGRSTEFFGFYSVSAKFGGIFGPLVFATVGLSMGASRWGILSLVVFFAVGAALLTRVNVGAGRRLAHEVDSAMRIAGTQG
jgi:UMF1 family MFS transporter